MHTEKPGLGEFLAHLSVHILKDAASVLHLNMRDVQRDINTLYARATSHGVKFFTEQLPLLGKALDKSLAKDTPLIVPTGFKTSRYGEIEIPQFLRSLFKLVYTLDGRVKADDLDGTDTRDPYWASHAALTGSSVLQIKAVRAIRQVCYLAYKLELPYSREKEEAVLDTFVSTDASLPSEDGVMLTPEVKRAIDNARLILYAVLRDFDPLDIVPGHGPGAVATGEKYEAKYAFKRYFKKVDEVFCYADYFFYSYSHLAEGNGLAVLETLEDTPDAFAKVVLVPKDSRGPRLISMEPLELQWIQQGVSRSLVKTIERHPITCGRVNFTDQDVNGDLALEHSKDGSYVTVDLKEASDRVSTWLVKQLFQTNLFSAFAACRSDGTLLPDGRLVRFRKFAPMGSALCFPVEALVFWALAVGAIVNVCSMRDAYALPAIYVYGDDLILPKKEFQVIKGVFEELHLQFNEDKCCTARFFRESCGVDAFKGVDVTPQKLRNIDFTLRSPKAHLAYVEYANAFTQMGEDFQHTAQFMRDHVESSLGKHPIKLSRSGYPLALYRPDCCWADVVASLRPFRLRFNRSLQRMEARLQVVRPITIIRDELEGYVQLLPRLRTGPRDPFGFEAWEYDANKYTVFGRVKSERAWVDVSQLM